MSISLIESKRASMRSLRSTVVSVALHAAAISLAVYATAQASERAPEVRSDKTHLVFVASDPLPETHAAHRTSAVSMANERVWAKLLTFSPTIPTTHTADVSTIPESIGDDHALFGTPGSPASASVTGDAGADGAFDVHHVDKPALPRPRNSLPKYPSLLERSRVEGAVLAQFVVDTAGRVDMSTFEIIDSTNGLFAESARIAIEAWRFYPAEAGGRKVKQVVQLPLKFIAPNQ